MKVTVQDIYAGAKKTFEGAPHRVVAELQRAYPHILEGVGDDLVEVLETLESEQGLDVDIEDEPVTKSARDELFAQWDSLGDLPVGAMALTKGENLNLLARSADDLIQDMHGFSHYIQGAFAAARFLAGGKELSLDEVRRVLWKEDGDAEAAALVAYGMEATEQNKESLRAVRRMQRLDKFETPHFSTIEAGHHDAEEIAEKLQRANEATAIEPIKLGGKHSKGSLLAQDPQTRSVYLLKPGSGGQSIAAGADEQTASQTRREAAFWHVANTWGLGSSIPRCDFVTIDGREYAAIELLPFDYKNADRIFKESPYVVTSSLEALRRAGILHMWAALDFICGNPDRHGANVMVGPRGELRLIDHGSAFAGASFDPSGDQNSFVPYYLRANVPLGRWNKMSVKERVQAMPRISAPAEKEVRKWVDSISPDQLGAILHSFGVDPGPSLARLARLQMKSGAIDEAINRLWVTT